jgi:hypothetical protein
MASLQGECAKLRVAERKNRNRITLKAPVKSGFSALETALPDAVPLHHQKKL